MFYRAVSAFASISKCLHSQNEGMSVRVCSPERNETTGLFGPFLMVTDTLDEFERVRKIPSGRYQVDATETHVEKFGPILFLFSELAKH